MNSRTKNQNISLLRLNPDNFTQNVWGGRWLAQLKKIRIKSTLPIGESWEFSTHVAHPSSVLTSDHKSISLLRLLKEKKTAILGKNQKTAPFLVKLIDAQRSLSLQVHPDEKYAQRFEHDSGKAEGWVILSSKKSPRTGFIFLGFRPSIVKRYGSTEKLKQAFHQVLEDLMRMGPLVSETQQWKAAEKILPFLNKIPVKAGDVFYIPPGTLHAIGAGVRLLEVQQTSDLTYRVWDWNRPVKRPLHIQKALDVLSFVPSSPHAFRPVSRSKVVSGKGNVLVKQVMRDAKGHFALDKIVLRGEKTHIDAAAHPACEVLTVMLGQAALWQKTNSVWTFWGFVEAGHSVLVPAQVAYRVMASRSPVELYRSYVPSF